MLNKLVEQGTPKDIIGRIQKIKSNDLWKSFFHSLFEGIIINLSKYINFFEILDWDNKHFFILN